MQTLKKLMLFSICLSTLVLGGTSAVLAQIPIEERQALVMLYETTDGDQWKVNTGWKTPPLDVDGFAMPGTENQWYGVTCNAANNNVTALQLRQAGLEADQLDFLAMLPHLRTLDLSDNRLSATNFDFLSQLTQLRNLYLHQNIFNGSVLPALAPLTALRRLNLSQNRFNDFDISVLGTLANLNYLNLSRNRFAGGMTLGGYFMPNLEYLDLSGNMLSGAVVLNPDQLKHVDLSDNALEWDNGNINSPFLAYFDFSNNRRIAFSGPINAPALKYLDVSRTDVGYVPGIDNLAAIETIKMQNCRLMEHNSDWLTQLPTVKHVDLSHNGLGPHPPLLDNLSVLEYLDLSHNRFSEPGDMRFNQQTGLRHLDLSHNDAVLQLELGDNVAVEYLDVSCNAMEQAPYIRNTSALQHYNVSHNALLDDSLFLLGSAPELKHFDISHNKMSMHGGPVPFPWVGGNSKLTFLDISHNFFRFDDLMALSALEHLTYLNMSYNRIEASLPYDIDRMRSLRVVHFTGNRLAGVLPWGIGMLENLEKLFLGKNHLSIENLEMLSGLHNLKQLHLDGNAMIGEIPGNLIHMPRLQKLEVGYNGLYTENPLVLAFMDLKDPDWADTQTVAPENVTAVPVGADTIQVRWDPIAYRNGKGGYAVYYRDDTATEPAYALYGVTRDKSTGDMDITGLEPGKSYSFKLQTRSDPSPRAPNPLISGDSDEAYVDLPAMPLP